MCVESCSMIIINSVIYIGLYYGADKDGRNYEILTVLLIFPHICVSCFIEFTCVRIGRKLMFMPDRLYLLFLLFTAWLGGGR